MSATVYWLDVDHGNRMPVPFYGMMKLIYRYVFAVYWLLGH